MTEARRLSADGAISPPTCGQLANPLLARAGSAKARVPPGLAAGDGEDLFPSGLAGVADEGADALVGSEEA